MDQCRELAHIDDGAFDEPQVPVAIDAIERIHLEPDQDEHSLDITMLLKKLFG